MLRSYKPELGSIAQAKYAMELEGEAAKKSRLGRIARFLRRLFWEF